MQQACRYTQKSSVKVNDTISYSKHKRRSTIFTRPRPAKQHVCITVEQVSKRERRGSWTRHNEAPRGVGGKPTLTTTKYLCQIRIYHEIIIKYYNRNINVMQIHPKNGSPRRVASVVPRTSVPNNGYRIGTYRGIHERIIVEIISNGVKWCWNSLVSVEN